MKFEQKPLAEINHEAIQILCRELGVTNAIRFINQFTLGSGNYVQDRDLLFKDMSIDDIIKEIKKNK